jgi:hypothetical protein
MCIVFHVTAYNTLTIANLGYILPPTCFFPKPPTPKYLIILTSYIFKVFILRVKLGKYEGPIAKQGKTDSLK